MQYSKLLRIAIAHRFITPSVPFAERLCIKMKYKSRQIWFARAALLMVAILWGSSLLVAKITMENISPSMIVAFRFTIAFVLLSLVFYRKIFEITKQSLISGAIIGAFLFGAYWIQNIGVTLAMPGKSAFLSSIYCVFVPFVSYLFTREKPKTRNLLAATVCIAGISFSVITDGFSIGTGDVFALLSGVFFSLHIASIGKFAEGKDPIIITILQFGFCALYSWIATLLTKDYTLHFNSQMVLGVLYLSVFCTTIALLLQNVGQKYVQASSASILMSTESIFGALLSVFLYGETITLKMGVGFMLIFISVLISEAKKDSTD